MQPVAEQKNTAPEQAVIDEYQAAVDDKLVIRDNKGAKMERYSLKPVTERTANHSMRDIHDIARLQYVLDHYDTASYGGRTQAYQTVKPNGRPGQADTVVFSKAVNGTYYVVEAVPVTKAGDVQTADADAWRVTSETKNAQSPAVEAQASTNSIIQSGQNYNSNPQPAAQTGNTSAKTDPASAALRQEYQTRVADAIQAGDYERAYALYREYRNPELRAFKDFYARKTFTEYTGANGYGIPSGKVFGIDESLTAFEESYQNSVENAEIDDIINQTELYAKEDEKRKDFTFISDQRFNSLIIEAKKNGAIIMTAEQTALRFVHAAYAAKFHKNGSFNRFYGIQLLLQCVFSLVWRTTPGKGAGVLCKQAQNPCT